MARQHAARSRARLARPISCPRQSAELQPEELLELADFDVFFLWCCFFVVLVVELALDAEASSAKAGTVAMLMPSTRVLVANAIMVFLTNPPKWLSITDRKRTSDRAGLRHKKRPKSARDPTGLTV